MKRFFLTITFCLLALALASGLALAQTENKIETPNKVETPKTEDLAFGLQLPADITIDQAHVIALASVKKAEEINTLMNIAVVDAGGNLKAFYRMDGAFLGSIDISIKKAKTARFFNMSTEDFGKASQPGQELYGIEVTNDGLAIFGGGELIKDKNGLIIGAIGVSGSSVANDMAVAQAGSQALLK